MTLDRDVMHKNGYVFYRVHRALAVCLLILVLVASWLFMEQWQQGIWLETDLQALMPTEHQALIQRANKQLARSAQGRVIVMMSTGSENDTVAAAKLAYAAIDGSKSMKRVNFTAIEAQRGLLLETLWHYRHRLITPQQRQLLQTGNSEAIEQSAYHALYGFGALGGSESGDVDPLHLFEAYTATLSPSAGNIRLNDGVALVHDGRVRASDYAVIAAEINPDEVMGLNAQQRIETEFNELVRQVSERYPGIEIIKSGFVFHSAEAARNAQNDMSVIGLGSMIGVVVLFLAVFRSLWLLLVGMVSVGFGCVVAFVVSNAVYPGVHILTLVAGASLIGVVIDYSLHYFVQMFGDDLGDSRLEPLRRVFSGLLMGMLSSVFGYVFLLQTTLPGLKQIALFSMTGLAASWLFCVVLYPYLCRLRARPAPLRLYRYNDTLANWWGSAGKRTTYLLVVATGVVSALIVTTGATFSDDIRALHNPSPVLLAQDRKVQGLLGFESPTRFLLVTGESEQALLQNEERLTAQLDVLVDKGEIESYRALSTYMPSIQRQKQDYQLLNVVVYGAGGLAQRFMTEIGYDQDNVDRAGKEFAAAAGHYVLPDKLLPMLGGDEAAQWLGRVDGSHASVVTLSGVRNEGALARLANGKTVLYQDNVRSLSRMMSELRDTAAWLLVVAYLSILMLLLIRYRSVSAFGLVGLSVVSTLVAFAVISLAGLEITLFHVLAAFLVLGLGMDYAIFIFESPDGDSACLLAVTLSVLTTCLSFGLLAMSSSPMLSAFGIVVLVGSLANLVFAPAAKWLSKKTVFGAPA